MFVKSDEITIYPTDTERLTNELLTLPNLPFVLSRLQDKLEKENRRRQEFYENLRLDQKVEFINGQVLIHSYATMKELNATINLAVKIKNYIDQRKCGVLAVEKALVRLTRNDFEPDIAFWSNEKAKDFTPDQMFFPAPDFVVEVLSESTEKYDRGVKFIDYALHGVQEYWIVDPDKKVIEQYLNTGQEFELYQRIAEGYITSKVIKGLRVDLSEVFESGKWKTEN